jgi:hypothetical protein
VGFTFNNQLIYDKAMPCCIVSGSTWVKFSTFIELVLKSHLKKEKTMHYFADFLFVGRDSTGDCLSLMDTYHKVYLYSGVPIAPEKHTEGPIEHIVSQGLTIDSDSQTVTIPQQKLEEIWEKINLASLNSSCWAVAPGSPFLWCLKGSTVATAHHVTRVNVS